MSSKQFKEVIFVCTANYYRSRFCEYLFNALAKKSGLRWRATSRGLQAWMVANEGPISRFTVERLTEMGIPFDGERFPMQLSQADLDNADLVVAVKKVEHHAMMRAQFPAWADRIEFWHVDDIDCATPDEALPECEACVRSLAGRLLAEEERQEVPVRLPRAG
ncbi:MAG: low molecular weight phosphatase family protein [Thermoguttaceae bacterium]|jgi:protein-tyrosine phosphatase